MSKQVKVTIDEITINAPEGTVKVDGEIVKNKEERYYFPVLCNHPITSDWWYEIGYYTNSRRAGHFYVETRAGGRPRKFTCKKRAWNACAKLDKAWNAE